MPSNCRQDPTQEATSKDLKAIHRGSVTLKVYETQRGFVVSWYERGYRRRKSFKSEFDANRFATERAQQLNLGKIERARLKEEHADEYIRCVKKLKPYGLKLEQVVDEQAFEVGLNAIGHAYGPDRVDQLKPENTKAQCPTCSAD